MFYPLPMVRFLYCILYKARKKTNMSALHRSKNEKNHRLDRQSLYRKCILKHLVCVSIEDARICLLQIVTKTWP